jgi:hypothetical protein
VPAASELLYRRHELHEALANGYMILVVEGEKDRKMSIARIALACRR